MKSDEWQVQVSSGAVWRREEAEGVPKYLLCGLGRIHSSASEPRKKAKCQGLIITIT
jgi:hypothetical protein